jgi:hypothetical protein
MKTHIASLLEKFNSVYKYQSEDNDKQIQAIASLVAVDILKTALNAVENRARQEGLD